MLFRNDFAFMHFFFFGMVLSLPLVQCYEPLSIVLQALCLSERQGRKGKYTQLNAEFQRIARGDKKTFLNEQCKEIEENNTMRKSRNLFKKIGDIKGTFHAKMDTIEDRKGRDLTEEKESKRFKNTQKNCTKKS